MRRRDFIAAIGATVWPIVAGAQQRTMPVLGVLSGRTAASGPMADFRRGLSESGYVDGRNVTIEYSATEYRLERLPALADNLVRGQVAAIFASNTPAALAAKTATKSIPIVFLSPSDPVYNGLVASLNRPGGNLTGISSLNIAVAAKRLQLLHELVPAATSIACLINPASAGNAETEKRELQVAARTVGVDLLVLHADDESKFDDAFANVVRERAGGLVLGSDPLFFRNTDRLVALAALYRVPAIYPANDAIAEGGLMSYGTDFSDVWRQGGVYTGRVLRGDKPADLPVQQVVKVELAINMKTAKALGLDFPTALLVRADRVIE